MTKMTTIKLKSNIRADLEKLKTGRETYGDVVERLVKRKLKEREMAEGYKARADDDLQIAKKWEGTLLDGSNEW